MADGAPSLFSLIIDSAVSAIFVSLVVYFREKWASSGKRRKKKLAVFFNWVFPEGINFVAIAFSTLACATALSFLELGAPSPYALLLTIVLILKPFFEEVVFRGLLLGGLLEKFGERNKNLALLFVLIQAALFTVWHMRETAVLSTFLFGIALGMSFVLSKKNLLVPYLIHLGYNLYIVLFFAGKA